MMCLVVPLQKQVGANNSSCCSTSPCSTRLRQPPKKKMQDWESLGKLQSHASGPKSPKGQQRVSRSSPAPGVQKVLKRVRKESKMSQNDPFLIGFDSFRTLLGLFRGRRGWETLFCCDFGPKWLHSLRGLSQIQQHSRFRGRIARSPLHWSILRESSQTLAGIAV